MKDYIIDNSIWEFGTAVKFHSIHQHSLTHFEE